MAYDEDAFASNAGDIGPQAAPTMAEHCPPTLAYAEDAFAFGAVDLGPPAPKATTVSALCPATQAYNEDVVVPHVMALRLLGAFRHPEIRHCRFRLVIAFGEDCLVLGYDYVRNNFLEIYRSLRNR